MGIILCGISFVDVQPLSKLPVFPSTRLAWLSYLIIVMDFLYNLPYSVDLLHSSELLGHSKCFLKLLYFLLCLVYVM